MRIYSAVLSLFFMFLAGCGGIQYSDEIWAPPKAPLWHGEDDEMRTNAARCNTGFYKGFSPANLNPRLSAVCKPLAGGNKICAVEAVDKREYWETESVYNEAKKRWETVQVLRTTYTSYMINPYINSKGLIYDCKAERGEFFFFKRKNTVENTSAPLPQ